MGTNIDYTIKLNEQGPPGPPGRQGEQGENGIGVNSIVKTSTSGLVDTYTITYSNGAHQTFTITNGNGISNIELLPPAPGQNPLDDVYQINYTNGTSSTFTVSNGNYIEGDGIDITNEVLSVDVDGTSIGFNDSGQLKCIDGVTSSTIRTISKMAKSDYDDIGTYYAYKYSGTIVYVRKSAPSTTDTVYSGVGTTSPLTITAVGTDSITLSDTNTYTRSSEDDEIDASEYDNNTFYIITE